MNQEVDRPIELDQRMLDQFRMLERAGRPGVMAQMIGMFLQSSPAQIAEINAASAAGDVEKLRVSSHTMKSTAANFGATALADACRDIEYAAKAGTVTVPADKLSNLVQLHHATCAALRKLIP